MNPKGVITRFPPSPTGFLHIGGVRTALFNYLFAKHNDGVMFFRFEDTDKERSKKEYEEDIIKGLAWLGITYEMLPVFRQSERLSVYKRYFDTLLERGIAYEAEESIEDPTKKVIRFKNPKKTILFHDLVRGDVSFDTSELGDFVIARSNEEPLYHFTVVVDDHEMGVTHVLRGEDHISNTPRQILILEALGFNRPQYAHIPLILASDKTKLSKRHGAVSINEYCALGYIPEALLNYLALLGWNPGGEQEVFSLDELIKDFSIERIHKNGAIFDIEKLKWFNHEHIKRSGSKFYTVLKEYIESQGREVPEYFNAAVAEELKNRSQTLAEAEEHLRGEFSFMADTIPTPPTDLLIQGAKADAQTVKINLQKIIDILTHCEVFTQNAVKEAIFPYATEQGRASVLWPMRVALSGKEKSPDPFTLASLIGKERVLERIATAISLL